MDIDEFKYNYIHNNSNGIYSNERIIREKYNGIYNIIKDSILLDVSFKEKVYLFVNNKTKPVCECCGSSVKFINNKIGYRNTCSNSCSTKINRHKIKDKMIEKYGVDHHSKLPHVIDNNNKRKIDKIKNIVGIDNYLDFNNNIVKYKCDKCNKVHETVYQVYRQRIQLGLDHRDCVTGYMNGKSNGEKELQEYIQSVYNGKIMLNDRKVLNGSELDIYLPELGLAFEFNGLYWHSELHKSKSYHYDKWFNCKNRSIDLIQIYEDEWIYKREIVESRIKSVLGIIDNKIYARKCEIRQLE